MNPWRIVKGMALVAIVAIVAWQANILGYNEAVDRLERKYKANSLSQTPAPEPAKPLVVPAAEPPPVLQAEEHTITVYVPVKLKPDVQVVERRVVVRERVDCALDAGRVRRLNESWGTSGPASDS